MSLSALLLLGACGAGTVAAEPRNAPGLVVTEAFLELPGVARVAVAEADLGAQGKGEAKDVSASLSSPGAPDLVIEAPASSWDLAANMVQFSGGVVATRGDVVLRCQSLDVRFDAENRVELAEADGPVHLSRGSLEARSQRALLTGATGRVDLLGDASLDEPSGRLSGKRIVLWLDDDRVECDDCRLVVDGSKLVHGDR